MAKKQSVKQKCIMYLSKWVIGVSCRQSLCAARSEDRLPAVVLLLVFAATPSSRRSALQLSQAGSPSSGSPRSQGTLDGRLPSRLHATPAPHPKVVSPVKQMSAKSGESSCAF